MPRVRKPVAVFLGPSLARAEASQLLDADYYPPARHGDIYRVLTSGARVIVLIDGVFHNTPSVWQRELLAALDEGVRVVGAASMGALRAAELHPFGMIGCGTVFTWYHDGVIEADDEVALVHAGAEAGYQAFSEPLVNIRATLAKAGAAGLLTADDAAALLAHVRARHYSERSYALLLEAPALASLAEEQRQRLRQLVATEAVNVKAADARAALLCAHEQLSLPPAPAPEEARRDASIWDARRVLGAGMWTEAGVVTVKAMLEHARRTPHLWAARLVPRLIPHAAAPATAPDADAPDADAPDADAEAAWSAMTEELTTRFFCLAWADRHGLHPTAAELAPFARALEERWQVTPTPEHLAANGLTARAYREALNERARYEWLLARPESGAAPTVVARWAREVGIAFADASAERLAETVIGCGPSHFGWAWDLDVPFARELQLSGVGADIAGAAAAAACAAPGRGPEPDSDPGPGPGRDPDPDPDPDPDGEAPR